MSKIEWTGITWNITAGCKEKSRGCRECYAARMAHRLAHIAPMKDIYAGLTKKLDNGRIIWTGKVITLENRLLDPVHIKKPTTIFVDSMSDLFHKDVPFEFIDKVFAIMALCPQHTFQVLTKRPNRMYEYFQSRQDSEYFEEAAEIIACTTPHLFYEMRHFGNGKESISAITNKLKAHLIAAGWYSGIVYTGEGKDLEFIYEGRFPLPNVWLMTSVENQKEALTRIPWLIQTPAAVHGLSCEPLVGEINLNQLNHKFPDHEVCYSALTQGTSFPYKVDWVICGGESGNNADPMYPKWPRRLRDDCKAAGVPFFFKQHGQFRVMEHGDIVDVWMREDGYIQKPGDGRSGTFCGFKKVGKKVAGRLLDGKEHNEMPVAS